MVRSHPLDRLGDQHASAALTLFARLAFDLADDTRHIVAGIFFYLSQQHRTGFRQAHFSDALQLG